LHVRCALVARCFGGNIGYRFYLTFYYIAGTKKPHRDSSPILVRLLTKKLFIMTEKKAPKDVLGILENDKNAATFLRAILKSSDNGLELFAHFDSEEDNIVRANKVKIALLHLGLIRPVQSSRELLFTLTLKGLMIAKEHELRDRIKLLRPLVNELE